MQASAVDRFMGGGRLRVRPEPTTAGVRALLFGAPHMGYAALL
jgi:hypothetical protein